jgi:hypothetical protein
MPVAKSGVLQRCTLPHLAVPSNVHTPADARQATARRPARLKSSPSPGVVLSLDLGPRWAEKGLRQGTVAATHQHLCIDAKSTGPPRSHGMATTRGRTAEAGTAIKADQAAGAAPFIRDLLAILTSCDARLVRWAPGGTSFIVTDPDRYARCASRWRCDVRAALAKLGHARSDALITR